MALGPNDTKNVVIPSAWDGAELSRLMLRDGTTYAALISDINDAVGLFNTGITNRPIWAGMMSPTTEAQWEYRQGAGNSFEVATEYSQPDGQRGETSGHMLPLVHRDYKLNWTVRWLEEARRIQIDNDIAVMIDAGRNIFEKNLLQRLFSNTQESGRGKGLGAAGVSLGFADASANGISYTPPPFYERATDFASTHQHYMRQSAFSQANLELALKNLWEHGHSQTFELIGSLADIATWQNTSTFTGFKPRGDVLIQYGQDVTLATVTDDYLGVIQTAYGTVRVHLSARVPANYFALYRSYGALDPRNPLLVRFDNMIGFGLRVVSERVELYPLAGAISRFSYGVGVSDRTNGVCVYVNASGDYVNPTIS